MAEEETNPLFLMVLYLTHLVFVKVPCKGFLSATLYFVPTTSQATIDKNNLFSIYKTKCMDLRWLSSKKGDTDTDETRSVSLSVSMCPLLSNGFTLYQGREDAGKLKTRYINSQTIEK